MAVLRTSALIVALAVLLLTPPLVGIALSGRAVTPYLDFPPRPPATAALPFSWAVFLVLAALVVATVAPFVHRILTAHLQPTASRQPGPMPWWGWAGLALIAVSWAVAWTRLDVLAPVQPHTFTPLWLGYIVTVNALCLRRSGHCMLRDRPGRLLALFPLSALFWWFFEFLNRFVGNWYYVDSADAGGLEYVVHASIPFSTVLPAVLGTRDLLATFPRLHTGLQDATVVRLPAPRAIAVAGLVASTGLLVVLPQWPEILFPMVWIAPLGVLLSLQVLWNRRTILTPIAHGDWSGVWLAALAALVCGFFWEMWNANSLARWQYAVPYVQRFHLFEMPLLGYAGYLPFGLQCVAAAQLLNGE